MEFRVTPRSLAGRGVRVYTLRIPQGLPRDPSQPPSSGPGGQSASCPPLDEPLTRRGGGRLRAGQALDLLGSPARSLGGPRGPPSSVATTQQAKRAERINKALNFARWRNTITIVLYCIVKRQQALPELCRQRVYYEPGRGRNGPLALSPQARLQPTPSPRMPAM